MPLASIQVENFRGLKQARLEFDPTTALIGENDSGKSTLLDAIDLCLGADCPESVIDIKAADFPRDFRKSPLPTPPLRIELLFTAVTTSPPSKEPVEDLSSVRLQVEASRAADTTVPKVTWRLLDFRDRPIGEDNDPAMLAWIRESFPVYLIRGLAVGQGMTSRTPPAAPPEEAQTALETRRALESEIETTYRRLTGGSVEISPQELQWGFQAARDLLARRSAEFTTRGLGRSLGEILGNPVLGDESARPFDAFSLRGTGAQRIGLLLLAGAFLSVRGRQVDDAAQPVFMIEDPEAHLHPLTLASVWGILDSLTWQKIVSTHSGQLLASFPLNTLRRVVRRDGIANAWRIRPRTISRDDLRKIGYHVRARRGAALFARCLLMVEGETEFWLLPELAKLCGYNLDVEGVVCVEFAQCGVAPLIKFADALGIEWHVLTDGDSAGVSYARNVESLLAGRDTASRLSRLEELDVEHCIWSHGYADVYRKLARRSAHHDKEKATSVIRRALKKASKPYAALVALEAIAEHGSEGVPEPLRRAIEQAVKLASA